MTRTRSAKVYDFAAEKKVRTEDQTMLLASFDTLECPRCETPVAPHFHDAEGSTHYHCTGPAHRPFTWRIAADGNMLRGKSGRRYFVG